jgi:outer membrane protein OmpA-like peptidoglycan-associated protein
MTPAKGNPHMRVRNWLLAGTSLTILALAPVAAARAQDASDPALVAAYQAYAADQSDDNKQKLNEACIAAGFQSFDHCVAAMSQAVQAPAPSSEAAPPPSSEEAPPPSSEEAAPAPSSAEAPPPPPSEEAAPPPSSEEAAPAPSSEEPAPAPSSEEQPAAPDISADLTAAVQLYNKGAADIGAGKTKAGQREIKQAQTQIAQLCQTGGFADTDSCLAQYGLTLDPIPEPPAPASSSEAPPPSSEAPAPSSEEAAPLAASSEEAAPAPSSEQAAPPASSEEAAPAPSPEEAAPAASSAEPAAPSSEEPKTNNRAVRQLTTAVNLYNEGVTDLSAGDTGGQAKVDKAKAQIEKICAAGGFADVETCLAQFGLVLNPLPAQPGEPSSEVTTTSSQAPAPEASSVPPVSELPNASEAVSPSAIEVLPSTVESSEAAPLLDSAKEETTAPSSAQPTTSSEQPATSSSSAPPAPSEPPAPPPTNDKQAQADIQPPPKEQQSVLTEKGKKTDKKKIEVEITPPADQDVKVIKPPKPETDKTQDSGFIIQIGVNLIIRNPEQERNRYYDPREDDIYYEDLGRGRTRETVTRPNGTKIVTVRNRKGEVLQRSKILPNGREVILATYDPRDRDLEDWRDPGADLPPLRLTIPADQYILDADTADEDEVYQFLDQPPVEKVRRIYTIDEVKRSARLRDSVRRLEVGNLTFDTGKATIARNQVGELSSVADAMQRMLERNPGEVFLIEGHTDAVGSDISNLVLSDQRAATVARILTDFYDIPPENLVTQGYGERYLKVKTDGPEPLNRRVTIKRITPLVTYASAQ